MSNFQLLVVLGVLSTAVLICSFSFPPRRHPEIHRFDIWGSHRLTRPQVPPISQDEDDDGLSDWVSMIANSDDEDDTCEARTRSQLNAMRKEIQSLAVLVGGLREKFDPGFKVSEILKEPPELKCPDGFSYLEQSGSCYKVIFKQFSWKSATEQCKNLNSDSHLVSITTEQESDALVKYLAGIFSKSSLRRKCPRPLWGDGETALWTSGQRVNENDCGSDFVWKEKIDETVPFNFTRWNHGEPNCYEPDENCMQIIPKHGSTWNDVPCRLPSCPICEYDPE